MWLSLQIHGYGCFSRCLRLILLIFVGWFTNAQNYKGLDPELKDLTTQNMRNIFGHSFRVFVLFWSVLERQLCRGILDYRSPNVKWISTVYDVTARLAFVALWSENNMRGPPCPWALDSRHELNAESFTSPTPGASFSLRLGPAKATESLHQLFNPLINYTWSSRNYNNCLPIGNHLGHN